MITTRYQQMHLENLQKPSAIKFCPTCEIFLQPPKGTLKCHLSNHREPFFSSNMAFIVFLLGQLAKGPTRSGDSPRQMFRRRRPAIQHHCTDFSVGRKEPLKVSTDYAYTKSAPKVCWRPSTLTMLKKAGRKFNRRGK